MLDLGQRQQALLWYVKGFSMATIAEHYGLTFDELANELGNV